MFKNFFKLIIYFLVFVFLGVIVSLLIFQIIDFDKTVKVPLLTGKSISEAKRLLNDRGLSLVIEDRDYDPEISAELIIRQDIEANERVKKGAGIRVFIGKEKFAIPYFEGMDVNDVELTLKKRGMEIGKITSVHSDTVEINRVITQRPLPGYFSDGKVNLIVSLGPYDVSYRCPMFVNMTVDEARKIAGALGLKLVEQKEGRVIVLQKPEAGAIIKKGDSVEITLGRGWGVWF